MLNIRKWKIKYKLLYAVYAVLIPVLVGITFYVFNQSVTTVREELKDAYSTLAGTMSANIAYTETDIEDIMTYVTINDDFRYVLSARPDSTVAANPLVWQQSTPAEFVSEMLYVKNDIQCFALYAPNGVKPYINARKTAVINKDIDEIKTLPVLVESQKYLGDIAMSRMDKTDKRLIQNNTKDRIVFGKVIMSYDKERILGYMCATIDADRVIRQFEKERLEENESIYLFDRYGNEIIHTGDFTQQEQNKIRGASVNWKDGNHIGSTKKNYLFGSRNSQYGYMVVYVTPKENWSRQLHNAGRIPIFIALALLLATFPIFNLVTRFITKPLSSLHTSMLHLQEGDFKQYVEVQSEDEMGDVTRVYNEMVQRIDELIDKNYVMVLRERESELDILQAQINPHFLYNTLDSLYWDAFNLGDMELSENIMALSELFRLALSRGKGIVTVETEFKLIESYLRIQKMRFDKKMDYKVNLLSEMKDKEIPKLIIQPFVENAIVHGLENTSNIGFVNIHGYLEEEYMVFKIIDNGVGMTEEQQQELFADDTRQYSTQRISKYAIKNVKERLKLRYNDNFELKITSTLNVGTTVTIKIPSEYHA
ncbi:MAG: sensor histidine kinase [Lachnospiraceae bacterium]|nr:sensor histidine kinase [Lachnospiraceae bacterium]